MKIHVLSDLHLEFAPFMPSEEAITDADVIVLAGDISSGSFGLTWARKEFPNSEIIYVCGNHELYGGQIAAVYEELKLVSRQLGIHFLDNETCTIGNVKFIGSTLWTDGRLFGSGIQDFGAALHAMQQYMADFSCIRYSSRFLKPADTVEFHKVSKAFIEKELEAPDDGPTIVVTHHVPSMAAINLRWHRDIVTAGFASHLDHLVEKADLWIAGHTHQHADVQLGDDPSKGRLVVNPRGYPQEESGFIFDLIVEVPE